MSILKSVWFIRLVCFRVLSVLSCRFFNPLNPL